MLTYRASCGGAPCSEFNFTKASASRQLTTLSVTRSSLSTSPKSGIGGSGAGVPTKDELVLLPGAYSDNAAGILVRNVFDNRLFNSRFPGPPVSRLAGTAAPPRTNTSAPLRSTSQILTWHSVKLSLTKRRHVSTMSKTTTPGSEQFSGASTTSRRFRRRGAAKTIEGRLITFPNILRHGVERFKLADRTKPGHMKIVALFLIDPNVRIICPASVPCQRLDWWREANLTQVPPNGSPSLLESPPVGVQDQVFEQVQELSISLQEAKESRLKLVRERRNFSLDNQRVLEGRTFSLC
ncbi:hypothetical protein EST38_g11231 [Candolleomyces aberdarensis]|uniref:DUF4246 domain-containing protein n=1 Tax=Candolleomyces aberdarensis TaxID=2316362 RepID=A0A4Q2D852_9AGAR|nr:hypothetical protein EST38_g11231 [Candolleomyces aberdarensis]